MLVLMRKPDETICIGNEITVTVLSLDHRRVKLGISAPRHVSVDRQEVAERRRQGITRPRQGERD